MQKKSPSYICELCKRSGKCVDSVSEMEDDNSEASEPAGIKLVSNSNQRKIPSSPALVNGKVCILAICCIISLLIHQNPFQLAYYTDFMPPQLTEK